MRTGTLGACPSGQLSCGRRSSIIYIPPLFKTFNASSILENFPGQASAKIKS
jgi:hypothetical protein|tara:strand:- start:359 stop:514 length:156 start_codon:yes stop_codon:yes gene_type:complete